MLPQGLTILNKIYHGLKGKKDISSIYRFYLNNQTYIINKNLVHKLLCICMVCQ